MQFKSEFAQILGEFLEENMAHSSVKRTQKTTFSRENSGLEPAHLAFLLGKIPVFKRESTSSSSKHDRHPRAKSPTAAVKKPHILNEVQKDAVAWFQENGECLSGNFTENDLKKAFRKLALRFHPDAKGGSAQRFLRLKSHEQSLRGLFTTY